MTSISAPLWLGLDLGTSGLRAQIVQEQTALAFFSVPFPTDNSKTETWSQALQTLLQQIKQSGWSAKVHGIIADATSSSVMLQHTRTRTLTQVLMYHDSRAINQAQQIAQVSDTPTAATGATSTLAKVLWLSERIKSTSQREDWRIVHQIDWLNQQLGLTDYVTDENNALKLGYDSMAQTWPNWVIELCPISLPSVVAAGTVIGTIDPQLAQAYGFQPNCKLFAGTTDSNAAFLASGANQLGDAVSSLGSTLAVKMWVNQPFFLPQMGIYSHRLQNKWLIGGASNSGGAVLLAHFDLPDLINLSAQLDLTDLPDTPCYPLLRCGERFPIYDPNLSPQIPQDKSGKDLLRALLAGLVNIEKTAYQRLAEFSGQSINRIFCVGGGCCNPAWQALRKQQLPARLYPAHSNDAAFGVTQLLTNHKQ